VDRRRFLALAAASPFALRAALAEAAAGPRALVTCDSQGRLAVVDLAASRVVGHVSTLPDPRSIQLVGEHVVVCHTAVGAVTLLDARTLAVRRVLHGFGEPRYIAGHPDGRHAYVTDSAPSRVVAVDCAAGRALGHLALGEWARHVTIDPAGELLWVGLGSASQRVALVDVRRAAEPRLRRLVEPPFRAHDVVFAPDGLRVWVTSGAANETAIYGSAGRLERRLPADAPPQHVAFAGGRVFVTSGDSRTCRVHEPAGELLRTTPVPVGSYNVQNGPGRVLTPSLDDGALTVLDTHGTVLARVQVAPSCHDACFLPA
jgi:DNA-binding beta-propeller fold protein YncE